MRLIANVYALLLPRERLALIGLALLMVMSGLLEVLGIGLLYPYVSLLQNPNLIHTNHYLNLAYQAGGFTNTRDFSVAVSVGLLLLFGIKGVVTLWANNLQLRFVFALLSRLGEDLLADYLNQPYAFFLTVNTADLINNLTGSVNRLCNGLILSVLSIASETVVLAGLVGVLLFANPMLSLVAAGFVAALAAIYVFAVKTRITGLGRLSEVHWVGMIRSVNEAISSAKEVQTLGREDYFIKSYKKGARAYSRTMEKSTFYTQLSRVILETGTAGGMVALCIFALVSGRLGPDLFPVLALFALATIRILPSVTRILGAWNNIAFNQNALENVISLRRGAATARQTGIFAARNTAPGLQLKQSLQIAIDDFGYPGNPHFRLRDIDITIARGQTIAFIGHSGSGKTTLADLILGLFPDFDGKILVDGVDMASHVAAWRKTIGYIPQSIYLRDDTIARNVAFGVPEEEIRMPQVQRAVHLAGLDAVVAAQPDGLDTVVGDRGIRLSGGERQRIGIARALYHDPDLLLLDEATSALDNQTEQRIVESILNLSPAKTIIVIAHRLSTVQHCDRIFLMRGGRVLDQGSFRDIAVRHPDFVNPKSADRERSDVTGNAGG